MKDEKGWYWHEKAGIRLAWLAFGAIERLASVVCWITFGKVDIFRFPRGRTNWIWDMWISLAAGAYLIDDLKRHTMPEHHRIGGVWKEPHR